MNLSEIRRKNYLKFKRARRVKMQNAGQIIGKHWGSKPPKNGVKHEGYLIDQEPQPQNNITLRAW